MNLTVDITGTLRAGMSGHQPLVLENGGGWRYGKRKEPGKNEPEDDGAPPESRESFCISGNIIGRETKNGGNGFGCQRDIAYTLTGMDRHAAPFLACSKDLLIRRAGSFGDIFFMYFQSLEAPDFAAERFRERISWKRRKGWERYARYRLRNLKKPMAGRGWLSRDAAGT